MSLDPSKNGVFVFVSDQNRDFWNTLVKILSVDNMFTTARIDVTDEIGDGENTFNIIFHPPVLVAADRAKVAPMSQPPQCPPNVQTNGQCHVNMIRKAGYSFSESCKNDISRIR